MGSGTGTSKDPASSSSPRSSTNALWGSQSSHCLRPLPRFSQTTVWAGPRSSLNDSGLLRSSQMVLPSVDCHVLGDPPSTTRSNAAGRGSA
ncbi:MAG: hypothetical protein ACK559_40800, partial [bacterium]